MITEIKVNKNPKITRRKANENFRILSARLLDLHEKERKFVAQELHDSIGSSLSAIKYSLENKLIRMGKNPVPEGISLEQVISMVQETIEECRRISTNLRPQILDDLGIMAAIRWLCREFQKVYSFIHIEKQIDLSEAEVPQALKVAIYRILQEALNNIAKHSGADYVYLSLTKDRTNIKFLIEDNGRGFDNDLVIPGKPSPGGMGLLSMKERTEILDGRFAIRTSRKEGTRISAEWPNLLSDQQLSGEVYTNDRLTSLKDF
ncbi:MAG: sensor histidine kinase [Desulfobacterales bacterium]|nr:sensor histidine kinase [Desulfobacterales bacterium]